MVISYWKLVHALFFKNLNFMSSFLTQSLGGVGNIILSIQTFLTDFINYNAKAVQLLSAKQPLATFRLHWDGVASTDADKLVM